jgi:LacI family transcriptional regulator
MASGSVVTIKDIARLSGVSITTVSRVLNNKAGGISEKTIERVRDVIEKMHYQPNSVARSMITKRSSTIGLIIPDVRNPFFSELARGVEDVCNANSFGCFLCNTDGSPEKENEYIRLLRGRVAEGILFTTQNNVEFNEVFLDFLKKHYPFCFIERYIDEIPNIPGIYVDNYRGAYEMTEFILSKGHRRIAFVSGPLTTHNARMRRDGYLDALKAAGIVASEELMVEANYRYSGGYGAAETFLRDRKASFTALFAANDLMALGAYQYLEESGLRVPDDISVAGFDNISYPPVIKPTITTIEIPAYELGKNSAEMLFTLLGGKILDEPKITFVPQLRDKGSVKQL